MTVHLERLLKAIKTHASIHDRRVAISGTHTHTHTDSSFKEVMYGSQSLLPFADQEKRRRTDAPGSSMAPTTSCVLLQAIEHAEQAIP
jgi:hypothetical protein